MEVSGQGVKHFLLKFLTQLVFIHSPDVATSKESFVGRECWSSYVVLRLSTKYHTCIAYNNILLQKTDFPSVNKEYIM